MTQKHSGLPSLPLQMSFLKVIGLRDPGEGDWARLRTPQYSELHKVSLLRITAHGLAALLVVALYLNTISPSILGA